MSQLKSTQNALSFPQALLSTPCPQNTSLNHAHLSIMPPLPLLGNMHISRCKHPTLCCIPMPLKLPFALHHCKQSRQPPSLFFRPSRSRRVILWQPFATVSSSIEPSCRTKVVGSAQGFSLEAISHAQIPTYQVGSSPRTLLKFDFTSLFKKNLLYNKPGLRIRDKSVRATEPVTVTTSFYLSLSPSIGILLSTSCFSGNTRNFVKCIM